MSIVVKDLLKKYGEQVAVDHISFSVNKGEIVGFLGPNGAGKSTTMKMITGYLVPDAGTVHVGGINVADDPIATKQRIGYLPEANPLYYDMYIKEYLEFIAGIHKVKETKLRIKDVIELTGLTVEQRKKVGQLSKGYKQRVGLAASLIHNPEVLILDEPTTGLDPNQILEIRKVIKDQGQHKTVLFSSHILQEVQAICDRVIIINKGKMVANDTLANLQQRAHSNTIRVTFREPLEAEWLQRMKHVQSVEKINTYSWRIQSPDEGQVRKQLLELALHHNLNIVSLQTEGGSLEEIFRNLTA
ncbi:gliding motility-associated ABC transporter ATP-binding subunit GldA [Aridibaculum aurantiacum]|uniref:gliding motility-associated ABC transporter ATP-binding subunit GldA n=1 Tax=Aridibaculum aurantiacum TaxID=2810307 RepID=UPI001A9670A6|nr:gliding motility-associated ABC transporter ATP-binding subunit GldA [Aridibaculum aurantiacum]